MGNIKEFKYKIDLELGAKDFSPEIAKMFSKVQQQADKDKVVLTLTGDDKDIVNQLTELKTKIPDLDLSKAITVGFSDALKEDGDKAQKYAQNFLTNIVNSVSEALKSIDNIKGRIKDTETNLKTAEKNVVFLGAGDADKALQNLTKRFQGIKAEEKNIDKLKGTFQQIKDIAASTGKEIPEGVKKYQENLKTAFKQDIFKDIKPSKTYDQYMEEASSKVFELRNQLFDLKKELETAENPEIQVKGKLADNFIGDLQSQLDAMTGIEVKVKPKIDKDVKLEVEVEGDVKPTVQPNEKIESPKPAEKIDLGKYDLSKIEVVNEKLSEYKSEAESISESAQKAVDELNKFTGKSYTLDRNMYDIPSTLREWNKASMSANDFKKEIKAALEANEKEKAAILYENLKTYYPKTTTTLDTFKDKDFKDNYDTYLSRGKTKEQALQLNPDLQRYRVLEDVIHRLEIEQGGLVRETAKANAELEKQAKISSELSKYDISTKDSRNSAIQSLDQQITQKEAEMAKMLEIDKNFQGEYHKLARARTNHESTDEYGQLLEKYNIPEGYGLLKSLQYLASQRGELQDTIDILKGVRQSIVETNEAVSTPPNTSGMDEVEEELHEEAAAHRANEEAAKADAKAQEQFNSQEAEQRVAEFKERVENLTFPDKRPGDNILDNFIVYIKKGTMEVDEAVQRIKDSFGALEKSQQDVQSQNPEQGFVEYVKKSDYEIYESAVEMAKNREKVLEELAQREIDIANKVEGETKNAYVRMGNKTWILNQQGLEDGDYRIDDKITSTKNLIDELGAQIEDEKDPKILSSLNEQLDAAKIKLIALTEAFPKSAENTRLSASDALSFGSEVIDEYARTQRERYQVGESNFNIVQEEKEYWDILTKEIKTEDDLTRAIERQKEALVDLSKKRDEADEKLRNMSYDDPNYKKAEKEWDDASGIYYDEKMKLYNLRQLKSNWGKGADQAPVINASFLDSEWRESDKYLFGIDKEIEQIIEAEQREAEQARKTAEEERKLNEARNFSKDLEEHIHNASITRPDYEKFSANDYNQGKKELDEYYSRVITLQDKLNSFSTDHTEQEVKELQDELYNAELEFVAAYQVLNDYSDYRLDKSGKAGGAKKNIKDLYAQINSKYSVQESVVEAEPDINKVRDTLESIMDRMNTSQITGKNLFDWIKENATDAEKELLNVSKGYEEFQKLLVGASFGSRGLFEYRDGAGLDIFNYNKNKLSSGTSSTISQLEREAEVRQENAAATDAQIEVELKRQSINNSINTRTNELVQEQEQATATAAAEENLSNAVSQEEHPSDVRERIDELKEEKVAADEAAEAEENYQSHVYKNQSGKVSEGNYSYTRYDDNYRNSALKYRGVVSTDSETGESSTTERLIVDYDKLLSEILKYDTQIYKLEQDINNAQGDTSGLEKKKQLAEKNLTLYTDLLKEISANPDYVTNANQDQLKYIQERRDLKKQELEADAQIAKANQDETQKQEAINSQMKVRANYYQKMWELRSKMHLADPEKDADQISTWKDRLNTYKQIYDAATQTLKQLDAQKVVEQDIIELAKIRQEVGAKYNDSRSKQKDTQRANDEKALQKQVMDAANAQKRLGELRALQYQAKENPYMANDSDYMKTLDSLISKYEQEANAIDRNKLSKEQIKILDDAIAESELRVQKAIEQVTASQNKQTEAGRKQQQVLDSTRASVQKQASALTNNGKLMKVYGDQVRAYLEEIKNPTTTLERLNDIRVELNKISAEATAAGQSGKSFFQILQQRAQSLLAYLGTFVSFYRAIGYIKESINTIRELDTELVDLRKTTVMTTSELNQFYLGANDVAKQLGVTTKEVITQASAWSRLGYNTKEAATEMARMSSKFAVISPGMDVSTAQEGLVSVMKAWDVDVADVESQIMDKINILGNNFAESNADIIAGMERSAAALSAVGTSYQDAFALFTGGQEILQNAEKMGTALRSISMRIRGVNEETEELDEELSNISGDLIDLTKTSKHREGVSVFKPGSTTEYKSLVDYLREVSQVWDEMNDKQKNQYLQKAFAKTQAQAGAAILTNFDQVDKALETMEQSAGSADREMGIVETSIDYKINKLKETWTGFLQETVTRDFLGDWVDRFTALSEGVTNLASKFGILKTALIGIGTVVGSKKLG